MGEGFARGDSPARSPTQVALLEQVGLVHILDGVAWLRESGGQRFYTDRTTVVMINDDPEQPPVHHIQSSFIHLQPIAGELNDSPIDGSAALHVRKVSDSSDQSVGDSRGSPGTLRQTEGPLFIAGHAEQRSAPPNDLRQILRWIEVKTQGHPEALLQRFGEEPRPGGCPDESERLEVERDALSESSLTHHHVDAKVLNRRVKGLLDGSAHAVDLVDEEHVISVEPGQQAAEHPLVFDGGPTRDVQIHPHFRGHDVCQCRLAEPRRPTQKNVVQRLAAPLGRLHEDRKVVLVLPLSDEILELLRAKNAVEAGIISLCVGSQHCSACLLTVRVLGIHEKGVTGPLPSGARALEIFVREGLDGRGVAARMGTMRRSARQFGILALSLLPTGLVVLPEVGQAEQAVKGEHPSHVYADAFTVWVYERPERSVTPIGMLRAGQFIPLRSHEGRPAHQRVAPGCGRGWYAVEPSGFVCLDHQLSLSPTRYSESMARLLPQPGAFPFEYALSMGTMSYRRLPTEAEWQRRERKYGPARARPLPAHWRGHEELLSDVQLELGDLSPFLRDGGSVSRLPESRLQRREVPFGSMLALSEAFQHEGRRFAQSADGTVVGLDRMRIFRRSDFSGVELDNLGSGADDLHLPLAWPRRDLVGFRLAPEVECRVARATEMKPGESPNSSRGGVQPDRGVPERKKTSLAGRLDGQIVDLPAECLLPADIRVKARTPLPLASARIRISGTEFVLYALAGDEGVSRGSQPLEEFGIKPATEPSQSSWLILPRDALFVAEQRRPPRAIGDRQMAQKWIHFNIEQGTLTAYRGHEPWFTTLASPGSGGVPVRGADPLDTRTTPVGIYRIYFKYITDDMSPEVGEHRSYWIADVPYTMYFQQPFAIHVAYWHESFGEPMSGGCINVSPRDGARLFHFADPPLPEGWYGVGASSAWGHGTWVVVDRN